MNYLKCAHMRLVANCLALPILIFISAIALNGCAGMFPPPEPVVPPQPVSLRYMVPVLKPVDPAKQDQKQGGVQISLEPYTYTASVNVRREYIDANEIADSVDRQPVNMREMPTGASISPPVVRFKVKVHNGLGHSLHLDGAIVSFRVDGSKVNIDKSRYEQFLGGILTPNDEGEYEIAGPDISTLKDGTTIALFLYDVPTALDAAGIPKKTGNFEFYYKFSLALKEDQFPVVIRRGMVTMQQIQLLIQRGGRNNWIEMPEFAESQAPPPPQQESTIQSTTVHKVFGRK